MGLKEPYISKVPLATSEVAEDLTYYFASSEQTPSAVGLGVLMSKDNHVREAGGFIVQLMPFAEDSVIDKLEANLAKITSITELLDAGMTPEQILEKVFEGMDVVYNDTVTPAYKCNCSKEKVAKAIMATGSKEIRAMIDEGKDVEVNCHFCNTNYVFTVNDLKEMVISKITSLIRE
jgi:molecular chaperone Hsp33